MIIHRNLTGIIIDLTYEEAEKLRDTIESQVTITKLHEVALNIYDELDAIITEEGH